MLRHERKIELLKKVPLVNSCTRRDLVLIARASDEIDFKPGKVLIKEGAAGREFFVIVDGEARVEADGRELARLQRGDFFGEVAILIGVPAIADVIATRQMRCLVLPGPQLESFLISHPKVMYRMLQAQTRRLRAANRTGT